MLIKKNRIPIKDIIFVGLWPSGLKKLIYRIKGYKIGKKVHIGFGSIIKGKNVVIRDYVHIGFTTVIISKNILIESYVQIGSFSVLQAESISIGKDSKIREHVYMAGLSTPESSFKLGERCHIGQYAFLNPSYPITFGNDSSLGGNSKIFTHSSYLSILDGYPVTYAGVTIGDNVWIPWDVFILPGITIGNNVLIGARTLVNKDVPSKCVFAGNPGRVKVKNFPIPVETNEKGRIINMIYNEFFEYLEYHGYIIEKDNLNCYSIRKGKRVSNIIYNCDFDKDMSNIKDAVIVLENDKINKEAYVNKKNIMILSLESKMQIGSSKIGTEFVAYLSRYGIRFKRDEINY